MPIDPNPRLSIPTKLKVVTFFFVFSWDSETEAKKPHSWRRNLSREWRYRREKDSVFIFYFYSFFSLIKSQGKKFVERERGQTSNAKPRRELWARDPRAKRSIQSSKEVHFFFIKKKHSLFCPFFSYVHNIRRKNI